MSTILTSANEATLKLSAYLGRHVQPQPDRTLASAFLQRNNDGPKSLPSSFKDQVSSPDMPSDFRTHRSAFPFVQIHRRVIVYRLRKLVGSVRIKDRPNERRKVGHCDAVFESLRVDSRRNSRVKRLQKICNQWKRVRMRREDVSLPQS